MTTSEGAFGGGANGRVAQHGTQSGYVTHHSAGEKACDACKAAHAAYVDVQRARRRGVKVALPRAGGGTSA
jgi:hypothetical protein